MYFPILRGRQFELLALRECIEKNLISEKILPIIEPVKLSSTFFKTIGVFTQHDRRIAIIKNPEVGSWEYDLRHRADEQTSEKVATMYKESAVIPSYHLTSDLDTSSLTKSHSELENTDPAIFLCTNIDYINKLQDISPLYTLIPDNTNFRRSISASNNRVLFQDHFDRKSRNIDYASTPDEFFSSDCFYYKDEGYQGFSDYSIVGKDYTETGFAPYAVAIHIVYQADDNKALRIAHFVSDSNEDISDPARKFSEAAEKLRIWNDTMNLSTYGINQLINAVHNKTYPGLGVIKKYSIMHHLELMSSLLSEE